MTADNANTADARRLLLAGLVDYAGLFPPAALSMTDAVRRYDEYRRGAHAWALGKFVVPVARLAEFEKAVQPCVGAGDGWELALIAGADFDADVRVIEGFVRSAAPHTIVAAIEVKASSADQIDAIARGTMDLRGSAHGAFDSYVEIPIVNDPSRLLDAIASYGLRAKVRTGGVETGAFPTAAQLARFLAASSARGVTFKATAGLHHAMRGNYPLTYDPASEQRSMFGFLNVFLAALFERNGLGAVGTRAMLEERDAASFSFTDSSVSWRGHVVSARSIARSRTHTATSFGSCSFAEPLADLSSLGLL